MELKSTNPSNRTERLIEEVIIWTSVVLGIAALVAGLSI